ncbi:MAG: D-glycero-beta-D-manno-heptose 1,7-bisphosphate 7-phosphatase [Magnetococcales bacterium]|nr:D-glycero-beta-D-manno-heptose 1,7-bisphosphate 7-phosphatase [Magnetococcales bacterium]
MGEGRRVILLDRDGVLNEDRPDYVQTTEQLRLLPQAMTALARLRRAGFAVLVYTNQACVGKGLVSLETLEAIHGDLRRAAEAAGGEIDDIFYCPHRDDEGCDCRKPKPGLILAAQRRWGFDLAETWAVGDAERDLRAAWSAGCRAALVRTGKGRQTAEKLPGVPTFDTLDHFVRTLLDPHSFLHQAEAGRRPVA